MRVGGAGQGGYGMVPYGAAAQQRRREEIEPPDPASRTRAEINSPFTTSRHPFIRVEPAGFHRSRHASAGAAYADQTLAGAASAPSVTFLAQFIAQENAREGLELDRAKDGASAYRRAEGPPVAIRAGANIDTAA